MEKKLCIGIDASRANRAEKTGVEWYAFHLIQEFKKLIPPEYRVILYSAEPLMGGLEVLPQNWESKIIKGVNLGRGPWLWTQLGLTLEMIFNKPSILFVPSHAIPLIHPKRTYTTIHDIGFEVFPESYGFLARLYHRFSARFALRSAAKIFTPSEFTKQELIKYYKADSKKIIVTPLGFDAEKYHPNNRRPERSEGSHGSEVTRENNNVIPQLFSPPNNVGGARGGQNPYILFVGRIEKKKNVKRLIQAFLELKKDCHPRASGDLEKNNCHPELVSGSIDNLKLVLVGTPGFGYNEIKASAGDSRDVIFPGYVPTADLPGILAGASVYALPSLYEGFGIPILEAMASGVPVLTSNAASMPEVCCKKEVSLPEEVKPPQVKICGDPENTPLKIRGDEGSYETPKSYQLTAKSSENCAALLVDPLSVESIKEGLKKILTDQAYHDDLVAKGLSRAQEFSWASTAKKTSEAVLGV